MVVSPSLHWHILGAGAIGSLMASHLRRAGQPVTLLTRDASTAKHRGRALRLHQTDTVLHLDIPCLASNQVSGIPALLITTKAQHCRTALHSVRGRMKAGAPVILLHNGLGVYEQLAELYPGELLFCATTTEAANFQGENELVYAGRGETRIGHPQAGTAPAWFDGLAGAMGDTCWESDIEQSLWRKLVINATINPLTAIHGCSNGEILGNPDYRSQAMAVAGELAELGGARGYCDLAEQIWGLAEAVMRSTAENRSSMLQDIEAGRPTEIDYISGYLCRFARTRRIPCPHNEKLWRTIRVMEGRPAP